MYFTLVAIASLLVMAFNINTNSMNVNAIDFGLISKDTNIGSIDTDSLFNCVGAAITCDNDNTVNNNIAINNGTNGNGGDTPLPPLPANCGDCINELGSGVHLILIDTFGLPPEATSEDICEALVELGTVEAVVELLSESGFTAESIVEIMECLGVEITVNEVEVIIGA